MIQAHNQISGTIPSELDNLKSLTDLRFGKDQVSDDGFVILLVSNIYVFT